MATCSLVLDKRVKLKNNNYNLSIRIIEGKNQLYLNIAKLTEVQYSHIFDKKNMEEKSVEFRHECIKRVSQAEKIISELDFFDRNKIKTKFFNKDTDLKNEQIFTSLKLSDLFTRYISENEHLSFRTIKHMEHSRNVFLRGNSGISITEIDKEFLVTNEKKRLRKGTSISSINSNLRDLRTVINYFCNKKKIIPKDYVYPFSAEGYKITEYIPKKYVLSNKEIEKIVNFKNFANPEEEFARNIWELLYRCNGINFADLLRLRWEQQNGKCFVFFRKKTEKTRKNLKKDVVVPIDRKLELLLQKVGDKNSKFVLGFLKEGYSEQNFDYYNRKLRKQINYSLSELSEKLELSVPLKLKTARDSYASVLKRSGVSIDKISEMLSHSNTKTTQHYLDSMDLDTVFEINSHLI